MYLNPRNFCLMWKSLNITSRTDIGAVMRMLSRSFSLVKMKTKSRTLRKMFNQLRYYDLCLFWISLVENFLLHVMFDYYNQNLWTIIQCFSINIVVLLFPGSLFWSKINFLCWFSWLKLYSISKSKTQFFYVLCILWMRL